ncbi:hypothetical protein GAMM_60252 [Gammaproteobacteria bacterium]
MQQSSENTGSKEQICMDIALSVTRLGFIFANVLKKVKKISKFTFSVYPLLTFAQAIFSGYETVASQLSLEDSGIDVDKQSKETLPSLWQIENDVKQYIFSKERLKKNFLIPFQAAISIQKEKIDKLDSGQLPKAIKSGDDVLFKELVTGEDYWQTNSFKSLKLLRAIDRRLRLMYSIEKSKPGRMAESLARFTIFAVPSASVSTLLVNIDHIGRVIGGDLALLSRAFFGLPFTKNITTYAVPTFLILLFLCKEVVDFMAEFSIGLVHKGFFYPLFTGIAVGMYEAIKEGQPKILDSFQNKQPSIPPEIIEDKRSILEIIKACYKESKRWYEKYDECLIATDDKNREESIHGILTKKINSSKRILEGRRAFFSVCKKSKYTEFVSKVLLFARASIFLFQNLLAKTIFTVAKVGTKSTHKFFGYVTDALFGRERRIATTATAMHKEEAKVIAPPSKIESTV